MAAIDRIFQFIEYKKISVSEFSKLIQVSNGYLAKQKSASANIGSHIIEKIVSLYPELNTDWLITGRGCMLVGLKNANSQDKNVDLYVDPNVDLLPKSEDNPPFPTMAAEPNMPYGKAPSLSIYKGSEVEEKQPHRDESLDGLIKHLVEQLNEKSEEIGALKQENAFLKDQLAQCAEGASGAVGVLA